MQYFFNDHLRWSLGWETPNQAGAFIATLLPWLWGLTFWAVSRLVMTQGGKRWAWRLFIIFFVTVECIATWALVKTYSRGALVGALAALGLAMALTGWRVLRAKGRTEPLGPPRQATNTDGLAVRPYLKRKAITTCLAPWLARLVLFVILLGVSDFSQRLTPDYAATDRSVTNRVDLWKGGLELIAISPLHGWGWGNSGASFMHWTQPIGRSEGYKSMVNSYLTVGVEGGLPALAAVLGGCLLVLALGIRPAKGRAGPLGPPRQKTDADGPAVRPYPSESQSWLPLAMTASWLAWLVCLFFSNLWIIPLLWVVPGVTFLLIVYRSVSPRVFQGIKIPALRLAVCVLMICAGLWLAGHELYKKSPVEISRAADGSVALVLRNSIADTRSLVVLPDVQVLGESYGQELRRWVIAAKEHPVKLQIMSSDKQALPEGKTVVAFGAACSDARLKERVVWRIHPTQAPDSEYKTAAGSFVQLAGIDVMQANAAWASWAEEKGVNVAQSWGLATDVRARWPELILDLQASCKDR